MDDLQLPFITSTVWILVVFVCALVLFHFAFVWPRNLSKKGWKIVDYFWLGATFLGVIGAVGVARQTLANNLLSTATMRLEVSAAGVHSALRFGTSGAICRQFVRSEFSPPAEQFDRAQREFDDLCAWFKEAAQKVKALPLTKHGQISVDSLGGPLPEGGDKWAVSSLRDSIDRYNGAVQDFVRLSNDSKRTELEWLLTVVTPFLFVIALALRITKVTGEICHES